MDIFPALEHTRDFFGTAGDPDQYRKSADRGDEARILILPTYLKDPSSNKLLLSLWTQAENLLIATDELIVIGFGLHPADAPARQLLASSLIRNRKLQELKVVAPRGGGVEWVGFCEAVDKKILLLDRTFEEWVLT